jgi:hypothetical protein
VKEELPYDPYTGKSVVLNAEQRQALDPVFRRAHPAEAAINKYYNPFYGPNQPAYQMGQAARDYAMQPNALGRLLDKGPLTGAATLGGIGALGGGVAGAISDAFSGNSGSATRLALLLGLAGAGIGATSGYMRRDKTASWRAMGTPGFGVDPREELVSAINSAQSINFNQRMQALAAIPRLSDGQARQLLSQIGMLGGAAAGATILRFLFGAGLMGTLAGGLLGGMLGHGAGSRYSSGPLGMPSMAGFDFDGNRLF